MSDLKQPQEAEELVSQSSKGADGEIGEDIEDNELLQEMGEEDEEIDLYNEETFGVDLDMNAEQVDGDPTDILVFCSDQSPIPPSPAIPSPPPCTPASPPLPNSPAMPSKLEKDRRRRLVQARGMFEDPAVMRTIKVRPSLKSLDSAIVDSGIASPCEGLDSDAWLPSPYFANQKAASMLQDEAVVTVIDRQPVMRTPPTTLDFLSPLRRPFQGIGGCRRGSLHGPPLTMSPVGQRYLSQLSPMITRSPVRARQPFVSREHYLQRGGFLSPRPSTPVSQPFTPKMMQLRFGPNSPSPAPFYSPSTNPLQRIRFPGQVTQLHPQHRRLLSQRQQRSHRADNLDPDSELMSVKEKEWIIRLQMIQLQSENPHLDDYYYQEYFQRMETKVAEEEMLGERAKRESTKLTTPYVAKTDTYTPVVHIEGSLGQVAVSTCYSPRRAIDAVHAHSPEDSRFSEQEQKDNRQQRLTVLHNIEKLYMILMEVEEAEKRKSTVFSEEEKERLEEKIQIRVNTIYTQLQHPTNLHSPEEFLPCLMVAKGKRLLARLLRFLPKDLSLHVLTVVTSNLSSLMSRDAEEALPVLYPSLCTVIVGLTFSQLIGILKGFTATLPNSKETCLTMVCQNKFGISLLYALLSQGERLLSSDTPMEAGIGDFETWTETVFLVARQLSHCSLVEPLLLPSNLLSLFCRYLDKRTVHQLEDSMERSAAGCPAVPS